MQRLDGIRRVNHLADGGRERKERHNVLPGPPPGLADRRVALTPFGLELLEAKKRRIGVLGTVDRLQRGHQLFAIFPGHERQAVADQVDDAGLHHGLRIDRGDRLGKAFEPVDDGDEDVVDAARLELVDDLEPEFGPLGLLDPQPQNVLIAIRIERERYIDGLVLDQALVADLDPQGIEEHHWVNRVERSVLPVPHLIEDLVRNPADEVGRDLGAVDLGKVALDLAHAHAARVKAQDLVVEAVEPGLMLGDQLGYEAAGPIARYRNLDLAILSQNGLRARAVAAVAAAAPRRITLLVAKVLGQLGTERALDQCLLQLFE